MSVLIATNENNVFTLNGNIKCSNLDIVNDLSCVNISVEDTISCDTLNVDNINLSGDIYVSSNQPYLPVGGVCIYSGQTAPSGWLLCDGSAISRTTYSRLFSIINTLYGSGDGSTTFNLPNLQERIPVGKTNSTNLGNIGGNNSITLTTNQMPSHTHTGTTTSNGLHNHSGTTSINGSHTHSSNAVGGDSQPGLAYSNGVFTAGSVDNTSGELNLKTTTALNINASGDHSHSIDFDGNHNHTFTTDSAGSNSSIDIRNKFIVMNYIIRY